MGKVYLIGAGPGDPDLLTVKALRLLERATVVLHDSLVSREVLALIPHEAEVIDVGKRAGQKLLTQDEINSLLVSHASHSEIVVRLKGGDPMIFGRADEEIAACRAAGIAVEVVPGITTAQGAAGRLLVSLTRRGEGRRLQYITGHSRGGKLPADIDWKSLADPAVTTVVYMPTQTLPDLVAAALKAGLDPNTPAVAVVSATRADERVIAAPIADLPARLTAESPSGPVVAMIGRVFADHLESATAASNSARGQPIAATR